MKAAVLVILNLLPAFIRQTDPYDQLQQLNGTWKMQTPKGPIYESWRKTHENEMQGGSYKINGRDTIHFETVKLTKQADGVFYIPVVKNENEGKPVAFKMISSDSNNFIFENKEHDFPQRIIYHIVNKDSVHAWIEGTHDGKAGREDYFFARVR
jgi:hypothetical protein